MWIRPKPNRASLSRVEALPDYNWLVPLGRAWGIRSPRGIEAEGFDCVAARRGIADHEADEIREAA